MMKEDRDYEVVRIVKIGGCGTPLEWRVVRCAAAKIKSELGTAPVVASADHLR